MARARRTLPFFPWRGLYTCCFSAADRWDPDRAPDTNSPSSVCAVRIIADAASTPLCSGTAVCRADTLACSSPCAASPPAARPRSPPRCRYRRRKQPPGRCHFDPRPRDKD